MVETLMTSSNGNFSLVKFRRTEEGPLCLTVRQSDFAKDYVIDISLDTPLSHFNISAEDLEHTFYNKVYVNQGMNMRADTFTDTENKIALLQEALDFARKVNDYILNSEWYSD